MRDAMGFAPLYPSHDCDNTPVRTRRMGLSKAKPMTAGKAGSCVRGMIPILPRRDDG